MLNTYNNYNKAYQNISINAVGGTLIKSHSMSVFVSCHSGSTSGDKMLGGNPSYHFGNVNSFGTKVYEPCVVLQAMLTGGEKRDMLFEVVKLSDYLQEREVEE